MASKAFNELTRLPLFIILKEQPLLIQLPIGQLGEVEPAHKQVCCRVSFDSNLQLVFAHPAGATLETYLIPNLVVD